MPQLARAHHRIHAICLSAAHRRGSAVQRSSQQRDRRRGFLRSIRWNRRLRFFAYGKSRCKCRRERIHRSPCIRLAQGTGRHRGAFRRYRENINTHFLVRKKLFGFIQLRGVIIHIRKGRVCGNEAVRMHFAGDISGIPRRRHLHMAVRARLRFGRIIKRPRAFARNAARLPVIVFVETAHPAVVIYRDIEMYFVTG